MKRASAACETKAAVVNAWVDQQLNTFGDDGEPASDRVAVLEARLGSHRK